MQAFPDFNKFFILDTDASDAGIGAVLSQLDDDNKEHVIAYASRTLSKPERRYCMTRKELLGVITFIHHFCPFLLGNRFVLRTDHGSLTWLANFKQLRLDGLRSSRSITLILFIVLVVSTVMLILFPGFHVTSVVVIVMCLPQLLPQQL